MRMTDETRKALSLSIDYSYTIDRYVKDGFSKRDFERNRRVFQAAQQDVKRKREEGKSLGWAFLPYEQEVDEILSAAKAVRKKFEYFVVLGIGGSALGPITLQNALCHLHYNETSRGKRKGPKFYVEDNCDPVRLKELFDIVELEKTCFSIVSKSGSTSETMAQYLIVSEHLKEAGLSLKEHLYFTTDEKRGNLIKIAKEFGISCFYIPESVGGRFSVLSPVGLFPAAVLGIDIKLLLKGAAFMDKSCKTSNLNRNPALLIAALQYLSIEKGKNTVVLMPYSDNLARFSDWFAQLWAESLGKGRTIDGKPCRVGQTPVKALGATDQHSQIQLYTEGPLDKIVIFLSLDSYREKTLIPHGCREIPDVAFLGGLSMEELIQAENRATAFALTKAGCLNYTVRLPALNEFTMGELIFLFELATAYEGAMLKVNAYDQPGVEEGKKATFALLGKPGFEEKQKELNSLSGDREYIV